MICVFSPLGGENYGVARSSPRQRRSSPPHFDGFDFPLSSSAKTKDHPVDGLLLLSMGYKKDIFGSFSYVKRFIERAPTEISEKITKANEAGKTRQHQPSDISIRNAEPIVNPKSTDMVEVSDREYLAAVERGDVETAQRMVDETAKRAGYPVKAWHGTPNKGITVFDSSKIGSNTDEGIFGRGFYFSTNKATAGGYTKETGVTLPVFLNVDKAWWAVAHRNVKEVADGYLTWTHPRGGLWTRLRQSCGSMGTSIGPACFMR